MPNAPTIACVLKSGGIYDRDWVSRLERAVARNLAHFRFVCLTDVDGLACNTIKLDHDFPGWWSKIELFRPGLFNGPVLYLDLDSIVVGNLARFFDPKTPRPRFVMAHDFYRPWRACSTAMLWDGEADGFGIYEAFAKDPERPMKFYTGGRTRALGDQGFIEDHLQSVGVTVGFFHDVFGRQSISSFKVDCKLGRRPPPAASVVAFHGKPKPHEITNGWVADAWSR